MTDDWIDAFAEKWGLSDEAVKELYDLHDPFGPRGRYEDLGPIGSGAMGEVRRVFDLDLNRTVAMKVLREEMLRYPSVVSRFLGEAQATAQLEHPGIIPIYDFVRLADGRVGFTMREVRGRMFSEVIEEVHSVSDTEWQVSPTGFTLRRLVEALRMVCEAVDYAHARGVVHRDLKPENVMIGPFGEVTLMDWGLAKVLSREGAHEAPAALIDRAPVVTERSLDSATATLEGQISGTPAYMPPEQARGDHAQVGPWSDAYSLGAILYEILSDRPPYPDHDGAAVVGKLRLSLPPSPVGRIAGPPVDASLREICKTAMQPDIAERYRSAGELAEALQDWLEGNSVRARAMAFIERADAIRPRIEEHRDRASRMRQQASELLLQLGHRAPVKMKRPAWSLQDEAQRLEREAEREEFAFLQLVQGALSHDGDLPEAHEHLSWLMEQGGDRVASTVHRTSRVQQSTGQGTLSLRSEPAEARASVFRYEEVGRRLIPIAGVSDLGATPLDQAELEDGSYLIRLVQEGHGRVDLPVRIRSGTHWQNVDPQGRECPIHLPELGVLDESCCFVPAGWAWLGGDSINEPTLPHGRRWVDRFAILKDPVRNGSFHDFLMELRNTRRLQEARDYAPAWDDVETPTKDVDQSPWDENAPVRGVSYAAAQAYAGWYTERTGHSWRLPTEVEWEKAARGVDERVYPWGNHLDPSFCCYEDSHEGRPRLVAVDAFPADVSPYGVRGLGGNVRDWVRGVRGEQLVRGGFYSGVGHFVKAALRYRVRGTHVGVGIRLVREI